MFTILPLKRLALIAHSNPTYPSGEPIKSTSPAALPDSTEDIHMFDSPERDSEDFERSLKKTMECIAQVCHGLNEFLGLFRDMVWGF